MHAADARDLPLAVHMSVSLYPLHLILADLHTWHADGALPGLPLLTFAASITGFDSGLAFEDAVLIAAGAFDGPCSASGLA